MVYVTRAIQVPQVNNGRRIPQLWALTVVELCSNSWTPPKRSVLPAVSFQVKKPHCKVHVTLRPLQILVLRREQIKHFNIRGQW